MTDPGPRVVLVSLDSVGHAIVSPTTTPHLWALREEGGWAPNGGRCDVPAVTYVSHATLTTGTRPVTHGVTSNRAASPAEGTVPGWAGHTHVQTPTLFDALRDGRLRSAAVCGDQFLVRIIGAHEADTVWPPGGTIPEGAPICSHGYALNAAVREPLLDAIDDRTLPFLFVHLNEPDTWGHHYGPDHAETIASYAATDNLIGEMIEALLPDWDRLVLIVISDHGMEPVADATPIDLLASTAVRASISEVVNEGGAALARVRDDCAVEEAGAAMLGVPGVDSWCETRPGVLLVQGDSGVVFASSATKHLSGVHGGPATTITTAIVGGGHPAVRRIATAIGERPPHLADWAPTIAALLGVTFPTAEGRNLAAEAMM